MKTSIISKCNKIKLVITDVDGVLTDGGMYYSTKGDIMKKFFTRDGMGVTLLRKKSIPTLIITKEKTPMVKHWAKNMKIEKLYDGVLKKELIIDKICKNYHLKHENIAYVGDDVNDLELLKKVGFSACPADAISDVKVICHYICKSNGGHGVFREISDLILQVQK
jgi:3-deoxy-D-manno-octulosonate 8-phosphate phosphatase (KDO 8-P phosphatase)